MNVLDVASRRDRHADLLNAAEPLFPRMLLYLERGGAENEKQGNSRALDIDPSATGDIGWEIVDVAIALCRHRDRLSPEAIKHLNHLLRSALPAWADRTFGRGNVNHPVIAAWLFAAAGHALDRQDFTDEADRRLARFIHVAAQTGDLSEYNSPTYLGPTLVGLANIGQYAVTPATRMRARLLEERIWQNVCLRWHPGLGQLAGPYSRAYADGTLGVGGVIRYLMHAVLDAPVHWDTLLTRQYDHDHDAEWATKIAASIFFVPPYLRRIAEHKAFPYCIECQTEAEDYTIDGREIYRGGRSSLTTYMREEFTLGTAERPYVDGGQTDSCIAFWRRHTPVRGFEDYRTLYVRYVANDRLPGATNVYHSWYGGRPTMTYSANLLHQDGRLHTVQHEEKAIVLAQPKRRENGYIFSLRLDILVPLHVPLDEILLDGHTVTSFPQIASWRSVLCLRDGDMFAAIRFLQPTDLGGVNDPVQLTVANNHLIISIYNLRGQAPQQYANDELDQTHNGFVIELGHADDYDDFSAFYRHVNAGRLEEKLFCQEVREIIYRSGETSLEMRYNPATQEVLDVQINHQERERPLFQSPHVVQRMDGCIQLGGINIETTPNIPAWMVWETQTRTCVIGLPTDHPAILRVTRDGEQMICTTGGLTRLQLAVPERAISDASLDVSTGDAAAWKVVTETAFSGIWVNNLAIEAA